MTGPRWEPAVVGMVLLRSAAGIDPFYSDVVAGLEDVLRERGMRVLLQAVASPADVMATYRRWTASGVVAGIVVSDLTVDDDRVALLSELGMPHVTLGGLATTSGEAVVRIDNHTAMMAAIDHLVALGHRAIGRVSGPPQLLHTRARDRAFLAALAASGIAGRTVPGDYSPASGAEATFDLLRDPEPPTAIIYDNDVMAVAGLDAAAERGVVVPDDLSMLAWDDSTRCRLADPPLSAMSHDVGALGVLAGDALLRLLDGGPALDITAPTPVFVARGTTAAPPATRGGAAHPVASSR